MKVTMIAHIGKLSAQKDKLGVVYVNRRSDKQTVIYPSLLDEFSNPHGVLFQTRSS